MNEPLKTATDPRLLDALIEGAKKKRTPKEVSEQRVSYIFSAMDKDSGVTKERIRKALAQ
jgi:hypothetical protein